MHTYTAPGGTVFNVNSDGSGDAIVCTRNGALRWAEGVRAEVPAADLLAFADWLRERAGERIAAASRPDPYDTLTAVKALVDRAVYSRTIVMPGDEER